MSESKVRLWAITFDGDYSLEATLLVAHDYEAAEAKVMAEYGVKPDDLATNACRICEAPIPDGYKLVAE